MNVLLMMTMSFGPFSSNHPRGAKSRYQQQEFTKKNRLFFKSMLARECFCRQQNKQKTWIPVVLNREKMVIFYQFFKSLEGTLDLFMQQNDIAVLRRCQRFFLLGLLFYDDASDFFLGDCSFTTVPGQLFLFFDVTHEFPYW